MEGESGVGKELVAQVIYHYSRRSHGPFLAINCAAIPEPLLESELFGHERGAFTGAADLRIGKFQQVDGGTLFLDEIGDMPLSAQAKMLRVLQDGSFERVGSNKTLRANVRVIAATNQNLDELVEEGLFRRDLFYRLKVFSIRIPPLRERLDDLRPLVRVFHSPVQSRVAKERAGRFAGSDAVAQAAPLAGEYPRAAKRGEVCAGPCRRRYDRARLSCRRVAATFLRPARRKSQRAAR